MYEDVMKRIGNNCKLYRRGIGYTQNDVAEHTCYSLENISAFENGRNDNYRILLWYFIHGMTFEDMIKIRKEV